ncbi:VIT1/CCC1 transporter family protein [Gulosibacter bifidus]|uniref:VIT family protein n=1 Tax=Gulosibacter bifidus TaxID=272239 RepID=A0ABW5RIW0_9MICO|nr:VIT family protein [Gulosibacter bifidus]
MAHEHEAHTGAASRLNWLRAGVRGANDGIVSVACILLGIIAANADQQQILLVGLAATISGAVSMALGEYVSVSTQRDTERRLIQKEKDELATMPVEEHEELVEILEGYGIERGTADVAARQIESKGALQAHLRLELGIDEEDLTNPWAAALSSAVAFTLGAALPLLAALFLPAGIVTAVTLVTLAVTGFVSAKLSDTSRKLAVARLVIGGALGLAITYGAGVLFGA